MVDTCSSEDLHSTFEEDGERYPFRYGSNRRLPRVILEAYEGYTVDEMVDLMKDDNILRRSRPDIMSAS